MEDSEYKIFKHRIEEDIKYIKDNLFPEEERSNDYIFNYWILDKLYSIDEGIIHNYITDGPNDGHIDCWAHFEELKELHIIQNKYYSEENSVQEKDINDFLEKAISILDEGEYKRSPELQEIYSKVINDPDYSILLHFYITNNKEKDNYKKTISDFNIKDKKNNIKSSIRAELHYLKDIYELYYGESFKDKKTFKFSFTTINGGTRLQILPKEYKLLKMFKAYYMMTPIKQLYEMNAKAKEEKYPIFEKNIREYLGKNKVNKEIIKTLKEKKEREKFFYYNNGITIICENVKKEEGNEIELTLTKPQVVNGCQTVNTIYEVLKDYKNSKSKKKEFNEGFEEVFVMIKIFIVNDDDNNKIEDKKFSFYKDIVKYTNSQTAIRSSQFGSKSDVFLRIQEELKKRGFLLLVKPSDRHIFPENYAESDFRNLKKKAESYISNLDTEIKKIDDLFIPLDKLIQVFISMKKDAHIAMNKKKFLLDPGSNLYEEHSLKIHDWLSYDSMIHLFLLCKPLFSRGKQKKGQKRKLSPCLLANVIGFLIEEKNKENKKSLDNAIRKLFDLSKEDFKHVVYNYIESIVRLYRDEQVTSSRESSREEDKLIGYHDFLKKPIDKKVLEKKIKDENSRLESDHRSGEKKIVEDYIKAINKPLS